MKKVYRRKTSEKIILKILMIPVLVAFFYGAARIGIIGGNYLYNLDAGIIEKIDASYFKAILNTSLPIITSVYNSGNVSISFTGNMKKALGSIFNFDLDYPPSIFNTQSPLFYNYYKNNYLNDMLAQDNTVTPVPDNNMITPTPGSEVPGKEDDGNGNKVPDGNDPENNPPDGNDPENNPPDGSTPDNVTPDSNTPDNNTPDNSIPENNTGDGTSGNTEDSRPGTSLEPTSSIVYEEDEEKSGKGEVVAHGRVVVQNYTSFKLDIEKLLSEPFKITFPKKGPQVLIYHTHTTESFVLKASDLGKKNIPIYNKNPQYNVVRVGEELARNLKKYGIDVLHNGTVHDSNHPAAYGVSLKTLNEYKKSYPSLKIFFDIHRDGLEKTKPKLRVTTTINKKTAAQVMFVVGTNGNGLPHPQWKENLKFALQLQKKLNEKYPGLARPVYISNNRYNEHISTGSLIIEIGADGNLLSECIESTRYVAEAVNDVIKGK